MDPVSAIGIAAAVAQFLSLGYKVAERIAEYTAAGPQDVPKSLININTQLPLLLNALSRIKTESEVSKYDIDTRCILRGVVLGCLKLVQDIETISAKIRPQAGESIKQKLRKVLSSLKNEERITEIDRGLQTYIQVLILHQVVDRGEIQLGPPEEPVYFEVKEKRANPFVSRDALISQLDNSFYAAVRSQIKQPQIVVLQGLEGAGKSQLALEYCYQAYELGQFRTIFWLDASTPEILRLSLEGAASAVRRSKEGSRQEKLQFFDQFLTQRWHPWLLILDDYQHKEFDADPVSGVLPSQGYGAILITTRNAGASSLGVAIPIIKYLTPEEDLGIRQDATIAVGQGVPDLLEKAIAKGLDVNGTELNYESSFLGRASTLGYTDVVKVLLDNGAELNFYPSRVSSLARAAKGGYTSIVSMLLDFEDQREAGYTQDQHLEAFIAAVYDGRVEAASLLLDRRRIDVDKNDASIQRGFRDAASKGNMEMISLLQRVNALPEDGKDRANALVQAAANGYLDIVKYLIIEAKFDPNGLVGYGAYPIVHAARIEQPTWEAKLKDKNSIIKFLLSSGALPNVQDNDGDTALHEASARQHLETMSLLISNGADPTLENSTGYSCLDYAAKYDHPSKSKIAETYALLVNVEIADQAKRERYYTSALHYAARNSHRDLALAVIGKADINSVEGHTGDTALTLAIRNGHVQIARFLIRKGADQSFRDKKNKVPLLLAAEKGLDLVVKDLAKCAGADVEIQDKEGNTPLIVAAKSQNEKTVKVLMEAGADKDAANQFGETALDIAEEKGFSKVVDVLEGRKVQE